MIRKNRRLDTMTDEQLTRIKELLVEWARWAIDRQNDYPRQSAFVTLRVDGGNRNTDTYYENAPEIIVKLDSEIGKLAPGFKRIVALEYTDKRPHRIKAEVLGIPRSIYTLRLRWIHEQLAYAMFDK